MEALVINYDTVEREISVSKYFRYFLEMTLRLNYIFIFGSRARMLCMSCRILDYMPKIVYRDKKVACLMSIAKKYFERKLPILQSLGDGRADKQLIWHQPSETRANQGKALNKQKQLAKTISCSNKRIT